MTTSPYTLPATDTATIPALNATLTLQALRPVLDALETLECRVLSSSADVNALSHLARRAKFDLLNLVGGESCA